MISNTVLYVLSDLIYNNNQLKTVEIKHKAQKYYNLNRGIVRSLAVHLIHLFLCSINPSVHFLYLSIQLLHLPLVVLRETQKILRR